MSKDSRIILGKKAPTNKYTLAPDGMRLLEKDLAFMVDYIIPLAPSSPVVAALMFHLISAQNIAHNTTVSITPVPGKPKQ